MSRKVRREIKLSEWAQREGINLRTAQRMHSRGELPVPVRVTQSNRIIVEIEERQPLTNAELTSALFALKQQLNRIEHKLDRSL